MLGPEIPVFYGDVSSTIASSTLPPGRLIVRVLKLWVRSLKGNANATPSAHIERITRTREETTSRSKTVSIDRVDASMGLAHR